MHGVVPQNVAAATLREARRLYELGLYLQAYRAAEPLGPLEGWPGLEGRVLAGQLSMQLGDQPRALRLHLRLHRLHPESLRAWYWVALAVRSRLGPYAAQALLRARAEPAEGRGEGGAELVALAASTAAMLKDFLEAERLQDRAEALEPDSAWVRLERSHVLRAADDYQGALRAAEEANALRPGYRPAVEARADLLVMLERDDEALALLTEAMTRFESTGIAWSLAQLQEERGDVAGAEATLDRIEAWSPLRNQGMVEYLARRRSDLAWLRGDREAAMRLARASRSPFHQRLAERLEAGRQGPRRVLQVAFVRQHDKTCAPATLTGLARFHGVEAQHLEIAEQICYDGTPDWAQRRWAEQQGFAVREFTVSWEAARALVDRGLPFSLATVEPGSAHLQAVVGYDEGRATLLIRDPTFRSLSELAEPGLETYRATGPHGAVMVPRDREPVLRDLPLPDAHLYDLYHQVQTALVEHRREEADAARRALAGAAPGHRLALHADRTLAGYDADEEARLAATEALLALFPDDVNLRLSKQGSLADLGRHLARVEYLRAECARAPHPLLWLALGEAIRLDARALPEVEALARRAVRSLSHDPDAYRLLGHAGWERGDRVEALRAYRAAACLGWAQEHHADSLFRAERSLGRVEEGLEFLRWRVRRQGGLSGLPVVTLYEALDAVERTAEAIEALSAAVERRPKDGSLLLFAARARAGTGALEEARALLERARGAAHPAEVVRTEASLADRAGELGLAAERWSALADLEPLDVGAARAATRLTAATRGEVEAVRELRQRVERFPHHQGLSHLLLEWLRDGTPEVYEAELRRLLEVHPGDAWAWRELATALSRQGRTTEALEVLPRAEAIDPAAAALHNVRGGVLLAAGRIDEAKEELLRSLACDADEEWALRRLLESSSGVEERRGHLKTALAELRRQVILGDGILAYQSLAEGILAPDELLSDLREAHRLRSDLWHTWVALGRQLVHTGSLQEAGKVLEEAAGRFPLLPRIPVEQAMLSRAAGDREGTRRALERAVSLSPGWPDAVTDLASVLQDAGDYAAELAVLDRALRHAAGESILHGWRGDALRLLGREEEARAALERALRIDPGYTWAWDTLVELCRRRGEPGRPLALAEAIAAERPHESRAWVLVARARKAPAERLEPLDRAVQARPRDAMAWELRVDALVELRRFDEALAATDPPAFGGVAPRSLRLRAIRIHDARGDRPRALADLRSLVRLEPDYPEAWQLLADWEEAAGNAGAALAATDELVRLAPHRAISHGYRGHALLLTGARQEGKAALRRALDLDPSYSWALEQLLGAEIEDGRSRADAIGELRRQVERFPDHEALSRTLIIWMREEPPAEVEAELRRFLTMHPADAWGWRELATVLSHQARTGEALQALSKAEAIDPGSAALHNVRAGVLQDAGRIDEAKAELLQSLSCDADDDWALRRLLELSSDVEERRAHLKAALAELRRQVILGDGILSYQSLAQGILAPGELLADLREAHALRPDLWHTWVALARQLAHAGSLDEAGKVLEEAAGRFPRLPRIPVEQAAVARLAGDRDATRRALEQAVSLSPGWPQAVADLAGLLQDAGDYQAELAVLDRALLHTPAEPVLHGWRAEALRLSGREAEARDELERSVRIDPGYDWAWDALVKLCREPPHDGRPRALAEAIAGERPQDARVWVLVARSRTSAAERLEPLARAIETRPRELPAWELRVDALIELKRFDEALAAASPPAFGGVPPRSLRLRAVRIHDARGDRARGLAELRALVKLEPDFQEAWQLVADWEEEAKNPQAALAAAAELVRLTPRRAVSHAYHGHALLLTGAREEGKAALRRAVDLSPGYTWALQRLLSAEIEDREEEPARRTLALIERHVGKGAASLGAVRLAARVRDRGGTLAGLAALARAEDGWDGAAVAKVFDAERWGDPLDRALDAMLEDAAAQRGVGELWATRTAARQAWWRGRRRLGRALAASPPTQATMGAASEWLERLAGARRVGALVRFLRRHGPRLRSDATVWGSAGFALCNTAQYRRAVRWLSTWRGREGLRPWMIYNLAQSLRDLGRLEEAAAVNRAALELPPDNTTALHRIHLAADAALAGRPGALAGVALPEKGYGRRLAELILALEAATGAAPGQAWKMARPHLARARWRSTLTFREPYLRRVRRIVVWRIACRRSVVLAPLWFLAGLIATDA